MPDAEVLDYLREQFARVHIKLDRLGEDVTNLKVRMTGVEQDLAYVRLGLSEVNGRLDRLEGRVARIEERLDLVGAH